MKKTIIYFLYKNRAKAEKLFYELIFQAQRDGEIDMVHISFYGNRAIFKNGNCIEMRLGHESARGIRWSTAYVDCDINPEIIQNVIIPSGKGSKETINLF